MLPTNATEPLIRPVRDEYVTEIDLKIHPKDSQELIRWKKLCIKELDWCQSSQAEIERLANELYRIYTSDEPFGKRKICLNFPALEKEWNRLVRNVRLPNSYFIIPPEASIPRPDCNNPVTY